MKSIWTSWVGYMKLPTHFTSIISLCPAMKVKTERVYYNLDAIHL